MNLFDWKPIIRLAQALYGDCGDGLFNTANFQSAFCDEIGCDLGSMPSAMARRILEGLPFVRADGHCYWRAVRT